jgi:hypothetical protein
MLIVADTVVPIASPLSLVGVNETRAGLALSSGGDGDNGTGVVGISDR